MNKKPFIVKKEDISYVNMSKTTCLSTRFVLSTMQRYGAFKVGKKETVEYCVDAIEVVRHIEIRLHTETLDKRLLQSELYDYEEQLSRLITTSKMNGTIANFYEINEVGSRGIGALMFNSRKEANQFNMIFFSNILRVSFDIRYRI